MYCLNDYRIALLLLVTAFHHLFKFATHMLNTIIEADILLCLSYLSCQLCALPYQQKLEHKNRSIENKRVSFRQHHLH